MCRSDLLLLDEPTNHLDLDAVLWLEDWLAHYPGTLLLITHDRDFLDAVVDTHRAPRRRQARARYTGNYAQFERERAQQLALQQAAYVKQQRQVAHLRSVHRPLPREGDQGQAGAEPHQGARAHGAASPRRTSTARSRSRSRRPTTGARQLLKLEHATLGYGDAPPILADVDWAVLAGARIGLLGPNGAGKSTLLQAHRRRRCAPLRGRAHRRAAACSSATSRSTRSSSCASTHSALWHLQRLEPQHARAGAARLPRRLRLPRRPRRSRRSREFSGGEKARLTLALLVRQRPNLLLLDEPTNHLDIEMREALDRGAAGLRRRADRGRARPPSAARDDRRAVARRRRQASRRSTATSTTIATGCWPSGAACSAPKRRQRRSRSPTTVDRKAQKRGKRPRGSSAPTRASRT